MYPAQASSHTGREATVRTSAQNVRRYTAHRAHQALKPAGTGKEGRTTTHYQHTAARVCVSMREHAGMHACTHVWPQSHMTCLHSSSCTHYCCCRCRLPLVQQQPQQQQPPTSFRRGPRTPPSAGPPFCVATISHVCVHTCILCTAASAAYLLQRGPPHSSCGGGSLSSRRTCLASVGAAAHSTLAV